MYKRPPSVDEKYAALLLADLIANADEIIGKFGRRLTDEQAGEMRRHVDGMHAVLQAGLDTMPEGSREIIKRTAANVKVKIGPRTVGSLGDGYTCVPDTALDVLIGYAVSSECSICMRRGEEVKRCVLRGVLRTVSDLVADARRGECGYAGQRWEVDGTCH